MGGCPLGARRGEKYSLPTPRAAFGRGADATPGLRLRPTKYIQSLAPESLESTPQVAKSTGHSAQGAGGPGRIAYSCFTAGSRRCFGADAAEAEGPIRPVARRIAKPAPRSPRSRGR